MLLLGRHVAVFCVVCVVVVAACGSSGSSDPDSGGLSDARASAADASSPVDATSLADAMRLVDGAAVDAMSVAACGPMDDTLRVNHVQAKGTHNSYHVQPTIVLHPSHGYSHVPLDEQLEVQGVRAFELDIHKNDATSDELSVYHIAVIDAQTTCNAFTDCLATIKAWSDANPCHVPISIWIEPKDSAGGFPLGDLSKVDTAVNSVFPPSQLLTPDDVRGSHATLRDALTTDGWPTLAAARGKVMFMLLDGGGFRQDYTYDHTTLAGRVMFVHAGAGDFNESWAGVAKINNPGSSDIAAAQTANILVASNVCGADQSDESCSSNLAAGFTNGVHMLKDDIPWPVSGRDYFSDLADGNPARCNPVTAPVGCTSVAIEDL